MTRFLLILAILCALHVAAFAQTQVSLNINHQLNSNAFALNQTAQNNLNEDFEVTRLQYYISGIELTHDGGTVTPMSDVYILVDGTMPTSVDLGDQNIMNLEKVSFYIGVDSRSNHKDPALWSAQHPLAPKFPSMHWGWTAGYRFAAFEGNSGVNMGQVFELHCLGDNNYFKTEVDLTASATNNTLPIYLQADYSRILEGISVSSGVIEHGESGAARTALINFQSFVFSPGSPMTDIESDLGLQAWAIFPNPSNTGQTTVDIAMAQASELQLIVRDALGRKIQQYETTGTRTQTHINLPSPGLYFVSIMKEGVQIGTRKVMFQ